MQGVPFPSLLLYPKGDDRSVKNATPPAFSWIEDGLAIRPLARALSRGSTLLFSFMLTWVRNPM